MTPSAIYSESIKPLSLLHSRFSLSLKLILVQKKFKKILIFFVKEILCNFLVRTLQCLKKNFDHKKLKKPPSKVAQKYSNLFSPRVAQTTQTEEFMLQNVAYRPTVYKTGLLAPVV